MECKVEQVNIVPLHCLVCFGQIKETVNPNFPSSERLTVLSNILRLSPTIYHGLNVDDLQDPLYCSNCTETILSGLNILQEIKNLENSLTLLTSKLKQFMIHGYNERRLAGDNSDLLSTSGDKAINLIRKTFVQCWSDCHVKCETLHSKESTVLSSTELHSKIDIDVSENEFDDDDVAAPSPEQDTPDVEYFTFGPEYRKLDKPYQNNSRRSKKRRVSHQGRGRPKKSTTLNFKKSRRVSPKKEENESGKKSTVRNLDSEEIPLTNCEKDSDSAIEEKISRRRPSPRVNYDDDNDEILFRQEIIENEPEDDEDDDQLDGDKRPTRRSRNKKLKIVEEEDSELEESSSDEDYMDDDRDEDFILPDDAASTLKEDSKLRKKVIYSLKTKNKASKGHGTPKLHIVKKDEDGKYGYGAFEFSGDAETGYICSLCPQTKCKQFRGITQHIRQKHIDTNGHICSICGKVMASSQGLKKHISIHERVDGVICQYCGGSYTDSKGLELHISLVHFPEYKYPCDLCNKKFRQISQVNKHKRAVHLKEKRFYCDRCSKGFFDSGALNMHLKTHSSDQPFSCDLCGQRFNRQCHKRRHIKQFHELKVTDNSLQNKQLHSTPNYAKLASLRETQPDILGDEEDSVLASLKCQHCGLQYNRQNNLTRHLLQIHHINVKGVAWKSRRPPNGDSNQRRKKKNIAQNNTTPTEGSANELSLDPDSTPGDSVPSSSAKHSLFITLPNSDPIRVQIPALGQRLHSSKTDRNSIVWTNPESTVEISDSLPNQQRFDPSTLPHQFPFLGSSFV